MSHHRHPSWEGLVGALTGLVLCAGLLSFLLLLAPSADSVSNITAAGSGPIDLAGQFPATGLLVSPDTFPEGVGSLGCDPSAVPAIMEFCTTQLLDTDWLIDALNAEPGWPQLPAGAKNALRRRVFLTAAHCTRPLMHFFDLGDKALYKQLDGNGYFDRPDAYPFDDPALDAVVGFNYDMGLSPGRVRLGDVIDPATCAVPVSPRYTVAFNAVPGYPTFPVQTLAVGGIPPSAWQATAIINEYMDVDTALMIARAPIPNTTVPDGALQRVYLSRGFDDPTKQGLPSVTVAGYGVLPAGNPALGFLGDPSTPYPNRTVSYRRVNGPITVTNIDGDGIVLDWQLAQGDTGTCGGDSGSSSLVYDATDGRYYTYADTSLGDGFCRGKAYMKRIGTPNWREWVRRVVRAYVQRGLDDGVGGSQHERILSSEEYMAQFGAL